MPTRSINTPDGAVRADAEIAAGQYIETFTLTSGVSYYPGQFVQFSNGLLVDADDGTELSNLAGVYQGPIKSSTAANDTGVVDQGILHGESYFVVMSDAAAAATDVGTLAGVGGTPKKILTSGNSNNLFRIENVEDTTNKIAKIKLHSVS